MPVSGESVMQTSWVDRKLLAYMATTHCIKKSMWLLLSATAAAVETFL